jgi:hypothetical protein
MSDLEYLIFFMRRTKNQTLTLDNDRPTKGRAHLSVRPVGRRASPAYACAAGGAREQRKNPSDRRRRPPPPLPPPKVVTPHALQAPARYPFLLSRQRHGATEGWRGGLFVLLEEAETEAEAARRRRLQGNPIPPILGSLRDLTIAHCVETFPPIAEVQAQGRAQAAAAEECHQHGDQIQR